MVDYDMSYRLEDQPWYNMEPGDDEPRAVVVEGNLSEGYSVIGPFDSWDDAARYADEKGLESWIMTLRKPEELDIPFG